MSKYDNKVFVEKLNKQILSKGIPPCPYCGNQKYTAVENLAAILIGDDVSNLNLGPNIPAGMILCEKCGHIEFFALGVLGMLVEEESKGEQQNKKEKS